MRVPWRRSAPQPSEDARHAVEHAHRALADAQVLGRGAAELVRRAEEANHRWQETRERNHVAEAVRESIIRKVRHS